MAWTWEKLKKIKPYIEFVAKNKDSCSRTLTNGIVPTHEVILRTLRLILHSLKLFPAEITGKPVIVIK